MAWLVPCRDRGGQYALHLQERAGYTQRSYCRTNCELHWKCFLLPSNHQSFGAAPTGGFQPYIYTAGGALIGPALPTNPTSPTHTDTAFDDFGSTMMGTTSLPIPGYVPTTAPASATNDALVTTITAGGGTTTLTVAANAGNTISGQTILLDGGRSA